MANNRTSSLTLQLIDKVSGPGKAAAATLNQLNRTMKSMGNVAMGPARALGAQSRAMATSAANLAPVGAAISVGFAKAAKDVYNLEKQLNISQAAGGLDISKRNELMEEAVRLNGLYAATSAEIVGGANELLRSGLNYDQTVGSLRGVLDASQAFDVPISDASAGIVRAMTQMRLEMRTTDEAMKNSTRIADLYAVAMNETAGVTFDDFQTSGKYFNPVATAVGMSPEESFALQTTLGKAGIYGSSAGTGLRSAPTSIVAPSKGGRAAFGRMGINPQDFVGGRTGAATGDMIAGALEAMGFSAEGLEAGMQSILDNPRVAKSPAKIANAILDRFGEELGVATGEDRMGVAEAIQNSVAAGAKKVDLVGLLRRMRDQGAGLADYVGVFGKNHASKMMALDVDEYVRQLEKANKAQGTAARQRDAMMAGIVGQVNQLGAAWEKLAVSIGKAGLLNDAATAIGKLGASLDRLADSNPALVRFGSYAALALAALAPLGFALSGAAAALALAVNPLALVVGSLGVLAAMNLGPISDAVAVFRKSLVHALDPKIIAGMKSMNDSFLGIFSARLGGAEGDGLGQAARNLGIGVASMANAIGGALPDLTAFAGGMRDLAASGVAAVMPGIARAMSDIGAALSTLAGDKLGLVMQMGTALEDFGRRAAAFADGSSAIGLVAASYNALASGFGAVYRVIGGVTSGIVAFASAFLDNVSGSAIGTTANAIAAAFNGLAWSLGWLKTGFDAIDLSFLTELGGLAGGFTGSVISEAIKGVAAGIQAGADALMAAANALQSASIAATAALAAVPNAAWSKGPGLTGGGLIGAIRGTSVPAAPAIEGKRASGGPIGRGSWLVGEKGPEIISSRGNGYVSPNNKLGGTTNINVTVNGIGKSGEQVGRDIAQTLATQLQRSSQIGFDRG